MALVDGVGGSFGNVEIPHGAVGLAVDEAGGPPPAAATATVLAAMATAAPIRATAGRCHRRFVVVGAGLVVAWLVVMIDPFHR